MSKKKRKKNQHPFNQLVDENGNVVARIVKISGLRFKLQLSPMAIFRLNAQQREMLDNLLQEIKE